MKSQVHSSPSDQDTPSKVTSPRARFMLPESSFRVWPWACVRAAGFAANRILALGAPEVGRFIEEVLDAGIGQTFSDLNHENRRMLTAAHEAANLRISQEIRAVARDPRFREAITWQNRRAIHTAIDILTRKPIEGGNKKVRQKERLVASYLQRYCVKNDTIGFFGPVCWARVTDANEPLRINVDERFLSRREVYFEQWCIDAIAAQLAMTEEFREWAPPRLQPYVRFVANSVHLPFIGLFEVSQAQMAVLTACDGATPGRVIAQRIGSRWAQSGMSEQDVLDFLARADAMRIVVWDFSVAMQLHPERALRGKIAQIPDFALRARAMAPLDELENARARVAAAAGDDKALDRALDDFEGTFQRLTAQAPTRADGRVYAARTLLYEDTHRAADVVIGASLLRKLGPPLSLLLASARWFTHQAAIRFQQNLDTIYDRLLPTSGVAVDLAVFHKAFIDSEPFLSNRGSTPSPILSAVQAELQARWAELLPLPNDARRVQFYSSALRSRVLEAFPAMRPGWEQARYVSPDIMIVSDGFDSLQRGDFKLVLGEVHLTNTLISSLFIAQHPEPTDLQQVIDADLATAQIVPIFPQQDWNQRTNPILFAAKDLRYSFAKDESPASPERTLRVADLAVIRHEGRLEVHHRNGNFRQPVIEFLGFLLTLMTGNALQIFNKRKYLPRITIDDVVICRETWAIDASTMAFAGITEPIARWIELKRWQRQYGIPRFVFLKSHIERKPMFMDLDGPLSIEILSKLVRQTADADGDRTVHFSEMLPSVEHAFFPDASGNRYTSELRFVLVDETLVDV